MKPPLRVKWSFYWVIACLMGGSLLFFYDLSRKASFLKKIFLISLLLLAPFCAQAATFYINPTGNDANNGTTLALAKQTIQAGINAATSGDTILVADGTYLLTSQISISPGVTVRSANGAQTTIIDGGGVTRCVYLNTDAVLDGFTVTNGSDYDGGGGVYVEGGTVENCTISGNTAVYYGGGVFIIGGTAENCTISGNTGIREGGGVYVVDGMVQNCTISRNSTEFLGGGISAYGGMVRNCTISGNIASRGDGGGVFSAWGTVTNCTISGNIADFNGGGVFNQGGAVRNCTIIENIAYRNGGGAYLMGGTVENCMISRNTSYGSDPTIYYDCGGGVFVWSGTVRNCTITENIAYWDGGGAFLWGGTVENCTINGNYATSFGGGVCIVDGNVKNCLINGNTADDIGGGVHAEGGTVENCTISGNTVTSSGGIGVGGGVVVLGGTVQNCIAYYNQNTDVIGAISYSCMGTDIAGIGNITNEPQFVSLGTGYGTNLVPGNYHLRPTSPCINVGTNQSWMIPPSGTDLDGLPRIFGGVVDMGAYEWFGTSKVDQMITFPAIPAQAMTSQVGLAATASSGLPVSFTLASGPGTIAGGTNLSFTATGMVLVVASQGGDATYNPAPNVTNLVSVGRIGQTITFPPIPAQTVTSQVGLAATASSGLSVSFMVASGPGTITGGTNLSFTAAGTVYVVASQAGNSIWEPATPVTNTVIVTNNPEPGTVQFSPSSYSVNEDAGTVTLTVTRIGGSSGPATVEYTTANGTALAGSDYTSQSGSLSWLDGDAASKTITVSIIDDSIDENNETFTVTLSNAVGAGLSSPGSATVTIVDNDDPSAGHGEADLEVSDLKFEPVNLWAGDHPAMISFDLVNDGPEDLVAPETQVEIKFYLSSNTNFGDADDLTIGTTTEEITLSAGSQTTIRYPGRPHNPDVTIPEGLSGDYYVFVSMRLVSQSGLSDPDGTYAMRDGPIRVRIHPSDDGDNSKQRSVLNDYDGDGKTDLAVYQKDSGYWYILLSASGEVRSQNFGALGYSPVPGDYDGDGKTDLAIYQESSGSWYVKFSASDEAIASGIFGGMGYTPVQSDYDGDGKTDPALYQETTEEWHVMLSASGYGIASANFGGPGHIPVPGDYDGDRKSDPGLYQESSGNWHGMLSSVGYRTVSGNLGGPGYRPVPEDYDGDGQTDPGVYQGSSGNWYMRLSESGTISYEKLEGTGYEPVPGDYDGDGKTDLAVYHEASGSWYMWPSDFKSVSRFQFGGPGYTPVGLFR